MSLNNDAINHSLCWSVINLPFSNAKFLQIRAGNMGACPLIPGCSRQLKIKCPQKRDYNGLNASKSLSYNVVMFDKKEEKNLPQTVKRVTYFAFSRTNLGFDILLSIQLLVDADKISFMVSIHRNPTEPKMLRKSFMVIWLTKLDF